MIMSVSPDSTRGSVDMKKAGQQAGGGNAKGGIGGSGTTGTRGYAGRPSGQVRSLLDVGMRILEC